MRNKILRLLIRSFDAPLGKRDRGSLERHLAADAGLRKTRDELLELRRSITDSGTASFRPGFVERTLARARADGMPAASEYGFLQAFLGVARRFAVLGIVVAIIVVSFFLVNGDLIPRDAVYYVSNLSLNRFLQFPVF